MLAPGGVRIFVATKPVDFRKGHDGLTALVKNELRRDPF
ncbi:MAG: IS66 family insertion sequence element accessory protein TnpB, partial [Nitratireductor sp.]|nr:IS66 family insertion sequence element accessory protein TnpB [Nitratireductor sp.]